jgi:S1-C subfamily serine protease
MRAIPETNLRIPILLKFNTGSSGSGFNIRTEKSLYFVTAKHVLANEKGELHGNSATLTAYSGDLTDSTPTIIELDLDILQKNSKITLHPTRDVAVVELGSSNPDIENNFNLTDGVKVISTAKTGVVWTPLSGVSDYDKVLVSNPVYIFGYPSSIGMQDSPQFDYNRPLIRKGIVASKYEKADTIILDCPVYYGNSGGPVIQEEEISLGNRQFQIIGVVSQFVPYVENWVNNKNNMVNTTVLNSGYSVAVSIDSVMELIK